MGMDFGRHYISFLVLVNSILNDTLIVVLLLLKKKNCGALQTVLDLIIRDFQVHKVVIRVHLPVLLKASQ